MMFKDLTRKQIYYFFGLKILEIVALVGGYWVLLVLSGKYFKDITCISSISCGWLSTYFFSPLYLLGGILLALLGIGAVCIIIYQIFKLWIESNIEIVKKFK